MTRVSSDFLQQQLRWRYATKQFDPSKKIGEADWSALEQALILTPSSFGLQPWKFVVVTDQPTKERLVTFSWGQRQPAECSHHVVFAIRKNLGADWIDKLISQTAQKRGIPVVSLDGYRKMMLGSLTVPREGFDINSWAQHQVYIALGNFMTSAAMLGIDACPMEGIEPANYDKILGLEGSGYATAVACAAGYRAAEDKYASLAKIRFAREDLIKRI